MADDSVSNFPTITDPPGSTYLYMSDMREAVAANRSKKVEFDVMLSRIVVNDGDVVTNNGEVVIL